MESASSRSVQSSEGKDTSSDPQRAELVLRACYGLPQEALEELEIADLTRLMQIIFFWRHYYNDELTWPDLRRDMKDLVCFVDGVMDRLERTEAARKLGYHSGIEEWPIPIPLTDQK